MSLYLERPGFSSGKMVFKDRIDEDGTLQNVVITARQQKQPIEVIDEEYVKAQAPNFLYNDEEWAAKQGA